MERFRTPLLETGSPLDGPAKELIEELFRDELELMSNLPTDDPLDAKRRRRVELTFQEIKEQPDCIRSTLDTERGAIEDAAAWLASLSIDRIYLTGCGDSLAVHVAVRLLLETLTGVPCEPVEALDLAYYYNKSLGPNSAVIGLSSSGSTTRTVEAMLIARAMGAPTLGLSNTPGSAIMSRTDKSLLIHAERKGWPTQASTAALALMAQLAILVGRARQSPLATCYQEGLDLIPDMMAEVIDIHDSEIAEIGEKFVDASMFTFSASGPALASAMFGAAKVKECSPSHAMTVSLEEFHHYNTQKRGEPLFIVAPDGPSIARAHDTAIQARHWGGRLVGIVSDGQSILDPYCEHVLPLPAVQEALSPLVYTIPVQLFAYHHAMAQFRRAELGSAESGR